MLHSLRAALLLALFAWPCAGRADAPATTLRVFYTGHSFHMFVPARLAQLAKAAEVKEYQQAGTQSIGGSRVQQHWDMPEEKNSAKKILEKGGADVFTMAPNVKMPDEGIDRFAELGLKHNPKLRLLVQESWTPGDYLDQRVKNNDQRDMTDLAKLRADQEKWRGQMEAQAKAINEKAGRDAVLIVPVGDAVVKLRELIAAGKAPGIAKQSELFTDPIGHGKAPLLALTAYCNFACITGRSPVGLKGTDPG
ncbi:MAG: hypothetical protein JNM56_37475, partial [Planctomycetia bacterium]|nr:hypothetical protein [Planctomycetia bacterium]